MRVARLWVCAVVVILAGAWCLDGARGDETPRVAALIRRLGSESYDDRTKAHAELSRLGQATREQLEQAAAHADPEIRLRARQLLIHLKAEALWTGGRVTLDDQPRGVAAFLSALSEQTGNALLAGDQYGTYRDQPITMPIEGGEFWPTLDRLCAETGNRLRPHYDSRHPGLVIIAGKKAQYPTTYTGPVRAQVVSAKRSFTEELDYEESRSDVAHTFQIGLHLMWEERFRLIAYRAQMELIEALTDDGKDVAAAQPSTGNWNVASGSTRQVTMTLRLHPPAVSSKHFERLRLRWDLIAAGDMATLGINDLTPGQPHQQDDVELILEPWTVNDSGRCELTVNIARDLVVTEPQEVFFQELEFELLDADGKAFRKQSQTNSLTSGGAKIKLVTQGETSTSRPTRLVLRYPRLRAQRGLELEFHDVPLPAARPE